MGMKSVLGTGDEEGATSIFSCDDGPPRARHSDQNGWTSAPASQSRSRWHESLHSGAAWATPLDPTTAPHSAQTGPVPRG